MTRDQKHYLKAWALIVAMVTLICVAVGALVGLVLYQLTDSSFVGVVTMIVVTLGVPILFGGWMFFEKSLWKKIRPWWVQSPRLALVVSTVGGGLALIFCFAVSYALLLALSF